MAFIDLNHLKSPFNRKVVAKAPYIINLPRLNVKAFLKEQPTSYFSFVFFNYLVVIALGIGQKLAGTIISNSSFGHA